MKIKEFLKELEKGLKNIYLLTGAENYYKEQALEKILTKMKMTRQEIFTLDYREKLPLTEIINLIESSTLFSEKNVILVKNAKFFESEGKTDKLEESLAKTTNYVIFMTEKADKRRKLYKLVEKVGLVLDAEPIKSWEVNDWLSEKLKILGKNMNGQARRFFLDRIEILPEISLFYLENEIKKINEYVSEKEIKVEDLAKIMTEPPEMSNFAIIEAINKKEVEKAVGILRTQIREENKIPLINGLLVRNVRQMLLAKNYLKRGAKIEEITKNLEVSGFIAKKISEVSKSYTTQLLEDIFLELADLDYNFKIGREGAEKLEKIVIKLSKRRN